MATPTSAVEAASWRSATRMSGRRRSSAAGSPTALICGSSGQLPGRRSRSAQRVGLAAGQHAQAMDRARDRRLQRPDGRQRGGELRLRARGVELCTAAGVEPRLRELERLLLVLDVAPRDRQPRLLTAQLEVGARHFGDDRNLRVAQAGFGSLQLRALCFDVTADPTEQVELPEGVEAGVVEALGEWRADRAADRRELLLRVAAGGGDRRREVEQRLMARRTCLDELTQRDAQVVVGGQRVTDELIQRVIAKLRPELRLRFL